MLDNVTPDAAQVRSKTHHTYYTTGFYVVNGGWGNWTMVRNCTKTCGGGLKLMSRICGYPRPKCGGNSCSGLARQWVPCNTHCCKGAVQQY